MERTVARKADLRKTLEEAHAALRIVLGQVADDWSCESLNEGWTVRDLLVHLTTAEVGFVRALRRMSNGQGGMPADFDPNRWNAAQKLRRADDDPDTLQVALHAAHADLLALLDSLDASQLDQRGYLSNGQEGSVEDGFRLTAAHKGAHVADIRSALSRESRHVHVERPGGGSAVEGR